MTYFDVAQLVDDADFSHRVAACFAIESGGNWTLDPHAWARQHAWDLAAQPSFGDAYAYAVATNNVAPGRDPGVITDGMILAAVAGLMGRLKEWDEAKLANEVAEAESPIRKG